MGYSMIHVDKVGPAGPGGAVRFVRRVLGVEAFGLNWFEIPPNTEGREHDELDTGPGGGQRDRRRFGQVPHRRRGGSGRGRDLPPFDPGTTRVPIAGPDGMTMIGVGARRGSYEPRGPL
jgi:hypothetical protein